MPEFVDHARNLQFGRIVLKSVTLSCSLVQMMAWQTVIERIVYSVFVSDDNTLMAALLNAVAVTLFSVSFVFGAYRLLRFTERMSVRIT